MLKLNGYRWRNLPCNCENDDPNGIRWVVSGQLKNEYGSCSGILEWCTSFEDAIMIYYEMKKHLSQGDKIYVDIHPIEWVEFKEKYMNYYVHKTFTLMDIMNPRYHKTIERVRRSLRMR